MVIKPTIIQAIPGKKIKASVYNQNFNALLDYVISTADELNTFVNSQVNSMNNKVTNLRMIGQPIIRLNDVLQSDEIRLEGAKVLKSTYASLTSIYGDTYAPADATDTDIYLYLPDARKRAFWGDETFGYIEAGLPNITGTIKSGGKDGDWMSGAFTYLNSDTNGNSGRHDGGSDANYKSGTAQFNASRSNPIFGKSNTVQPPAIKFRVVTRYK